MQHQRCHRQQEHPATGRTLTAAAGRGRGCQEGGRPWPRWRRCESAWGRSSREGHTYRRSRRCPAGIPASWIHARHEASRPAVRRYCSRHARRPVRTRSASPHRTETPIALRLFQVLGKMGSPGSSASTPRTAGMSISSPFEDDGYPQLARPVSRHRIGSVPVVAVSSVKRGRGRRCDSLQFRGKATRRTPRWRCRSCDGRRG